jgi:hypothetical protein
VIYFLGDDYQPKHIIFGLFEPIGIIGHILVKTLTKLLDSYALRRKIITYVKDEGSNLNTMATTLKSIVSCDILGLEESFQGRCFGHAFSKACQHATIEGKSLQILTICVNQICSKRFVEMNNLAKFFWKG